MSQPTDATAETTAADAGDADAPGIGDGSAIPASDDTGSADGEAGLPAFPGASGGRHRRPHQRRMWLQGGKSTRRWGSIFIGWAIVSLGAGVLAATAATQLVGGVVGGWVGTVLLWVAMALPVVVAYTRSVPRGLLRFRWTDLLFGVVFGVALRAIAGWLEAAASGVSVWPSYMTVDGRLTGDVWFGDVVVPIVISPAIEELFFHGFLLVALYTAFRRLTRAPWVAGFGAALVSTGLFVLLHQLTGSLSTGWDGAVSIALVGLTGALLVLVTGRLWGALVTHVVFNATYVALALAGTLLGVGTGGGAGLS